jgi:hypothetical protein
MFRGVVMTRGINDRVADDTGFAKSVIQGLKRFWMADWGTVGSEDSKTNDVDNLNLANGGYGRIIAAYGEEEDKFWIIKEPGVTTILFPSEY